MKLCVFLRIGMTGMTGTICDSYFHTWIWPLLGLFIMYDIGLLWNVYLLLLKPITRTATCSAVKRHTKSKHWCQKVPGKIKNVLTLLNDVEYSIFVQQSTEYIDGSTLIVTDLSVSNSFDTATLLALTAICVLTKQQTRLPYLSGNNGLQNITDMTSNVNSFHYAN